MISPKLTKTFRTSTGAKFRGLLSDPEDRWDGDELRARRILRVDPRTPLKTGDVINGDGGEYILFTHSHRTGETRLLAFEITHRLTWSRKTTVIDPVTKLARGDTETEMAVALPVTVEPKSQIEVQGIERNRYTIRAPGQFEKGDRLGPYLIQSVSLVPGASILGAV